MTTVLKKPLPKQLRQLNKKLSLLRGIKYARIEEQYISLIETRTYRCMYAGINDVTLNIGIAGDEEVVSEWVEEFIEINKPAVTDILSDIETLRKKADKLEEQIKLYYEVEIGEGEYESRL